MRTLSILIAAGAVLSLSSMFTSTEAATRTTVTSSNPPRFSTTTATKHRSSIAKKRGANAYGFCPPGQAKKPGSGSAFRC